MSKQTPISPVTMSSPTTLRSRRGSINSISVSSQVDKEQLALTLDKIHTSASQSDTLTTFNDFGPPPARAPSTEPKGATGDLVQQGLSGLYSRIKEAVGVVGKSPAQEADDVDNLGPVSKKSPNPPNTPSKASVASLPRAESGGTNATFNSALSSDMPTTATTSSGIITADSHSQMPQSSKASSITTMTASKSTHSSGQNLTKMAKAAASTVIDPTLASASVAPFMDRSRGLGVRTEEAASRNTSRRSISRPSNSHMPANPSASSSLYDVIDSKTTAANERAAISKPARRDDAVSHDGSSDIALSPVKILPLSSANLQASDMRLTASGPRLSARDALKKPAVIDRLSRSSTSIDKQSRSSSVERSTAEPSPVITSAHNAVYHDSFAHAERPQTLQSGRMRIPGTTTNEGAPEMVNARLELMRKQVLSKEFWMADDICKECFLCGDPFSAFRRKHHCRTCGCIFDSKCTSTIPGQNFGVPGTLRVCKTCLDIINKRYDSGSDDSGDDSAVFGMLRPNTSKPLTMRTRLRTDDEMSISERAEDAGGNRSAMTPMMAIPATRRIGDPSNRHSAILEIDAPQLSRPSSSRSLRSLASGRPQSSGHKRHHSKHNFLARFKPTNEERVPFRISVSDELHRKSKLPAFHDDNIIDPELEQYMSEDSSGDEQMSIFAAMTTSDIAASSLDPEKPSFGPFLSAGRKHRMRQGEKSISGLSFTSRGLDDTMGAPTIISHSRPTRRRNLSTTSASQHHLRSPRPKSGIFKGPSLSNEALGVFDTAGSFETTQLTRSNSIKDERAPAEELSPSSLRHAKKLFRQLLQDAEIPNPSAWERSLIPILIRCADDVEPEPPFDRMDIRTYVKLKKIPGGKPSDTSYVSGVIFTKNVALKSMPRSIVGPRIVIISFPIEYQRQQQHFMSLGPVIEQEKEYLRMVVSRIINLRPQVLLAEKSVSGVALQFLAEANIAVAYNVKQSVIEAVARCAGSEIVSSLDMLALPITVGQVGGFEVRTYVNNELPGRKKSYIFISGCEETLGCTIALRGLSTPHLARMKRITEFMVYVVYNMKLESCLMRDEYLIIPGEVDEASVPSSSRQVTDGSVPSNTEPRATADNSAVDLTRGASERASQTDSNGSADKAEEKDASQESSHLPEATRKLVSLHETHSKASRDSQVPEDVPAPTFYSDMVAKYGTKILSASPFVKFTQPYLLTKAREQERRLAYLKRLRDQDIIEEQGENEKAERQRFQLVQPEMVHEIGQKAPRQIMEVLHAVHDAEYDKALYHYKTQTRQWEAALSENPDVFNPFSHQNIMVLFSIICSETKIPCTEPHLMAMEFYDERPDPASNFIPDVTLGQHIEMLCDEADDLCSATGCDRPMWQHHRTYVHNEARITTFVERDASVPAALVLNEKTREEDNIFMWRYCRICNKELAIMPMSHSSSKYSFGKYLEQSFWSTGLALHGNDCPHDHRKDHIRYFHFHGYSVRFHYDPIDLLEIVVPRARITWKVDHDLRLKNETFTKSQDRWVRFMNSVKARIKSIRIDSVLPDKAEACKSDVERLTRKAQEDQPILIGHLQEAYMSSKYYEIIPLNVVVREMLEKVTEWDTAFAKFEADYLSDKDVKQLTIIQLRKMFTDNDSKESLPSTDGTSIISSESDDRSTPQTTQTSMTETDEKSVTQPTDTEPSLMGVSSIDTSQDASSLARPNKEGLSEQDAVILDRVEPLDLATPTSPNLVKNSHTSVPKAEVARSASDEREASTLVEGTPTSPTRPPMQHISDSGLVPSTASLAEKIEQPRVGPGPPPTDPNSGTADKSRETPSRAPERGVARRAGLTVSPPIVRAMTQPVGIVPRSQSATGKHGLAKDAKAPDTSGTTEIKKVPAENNAKVEKKFSDRIGLGALKPHRKAGQSSIPRYVHKKKESKVTSLAKHFEQLSREFEKERVRDRKQRAAKMHHSRAFLPRSSTKAIVEVYDDVNQAVEEQGPIDDDHLSRESQQTKSPSSQPGADFEVTPADPIKALADKEDSSPTDPSSQADDAAREPEADDSRHNESAAASDDEGASDVEQSLEDILPDVETIAEHLEPGGEVPAELQKDKKSNLMKMLSNFWAERSASGWPQLEYPLKATDHILYDSDVIVREDEPSSLIAFALSSQDYQAKLAQIRYQWKMTGKREGSADTDEKSGISQSTDTVYDEGELEQSLLRITGTHLKYQFAQGSTKMLCKIFYAEQFDAIRQRCGVADRIVESLSRCLKWDSKGGKTKAVFLKTLDDRLVMKSLSPIETSAFLKFAPAYFSLMDQTLFHDLPSVIAKMLGFFQVFVKNPVTGTEIKLDLLVMENLFYDRVETRKFDLKGSMRNRKIQSTGEQNEVLLDENMVEYIYESPLFAREHSKKVLRVSVWNDTLFLARQDVMDYSLMVAVDESRKELVVGIIDCIRTYTWDKKLESWIKDRGFAGGGRNRPTVTSPKEYKSRFREAMARYILQAPDSWAQFIIPLLAPAAPRTRFEGMLEGE